MPGRGLSSPGVFHRLLVGLFGRDWRPGEHLVEMDLAARFGVSRTPVREALNRLAAVGLIELRPHRGAVVRDVGLEAVREVYEVREVLEAEAARRACGRMPPERLAELQSSMERLAATGVTQRWMEQAWAADCELHDAVAANCGNRQLREEIRRYGCFVQSIREVVGSPPAQDRAVIEHLEILRALRSGRPAAAEAAMRAHIRQAGQVALHALSGRFSHLADASGPSQAVARRQRRRVPPPPAPTALPL